MPSVINFDNSFLPLIVDGNQTNPRIGVSNVLHLKDNSGCTVNLTSREPRSPIHTQLTFQDINGGLKIIQQGLHENRFQKIPLPPITPSPEVATLKALFPHILGRSGVQRYSYERVASVRTVLSDGLNNQDHIGDDKTEQAGLTDNIAALVYLFGDVIGDRFSINSTGADDPKILDRLYIVPRQNSLTLIDADRKFGEILISNVGKKAGRYSAIPKLKIIQSLKIDGKPFEFIWQNTEYLGTHDLVALTELGIVNIGWVHTARNSDMQEVVGNTFKNEVADKKVVDALCKNEKLLRNNRSNRPSSH